MFSFVNVYFRNNAKADFLAQGGARDTSLIYYKPSGGRGAQGTDKVCGVLRGKKGKLIF